ncbi:hypothetical protein Q3G72_015353 [Acer saccharum]|nr:hypothetical protein Q3G72_015353 [Acer saccharum]
MPFNIACDEDLLWFGDRIPQDRVHSYEISDDHNRAQAAEEGDGPEDCEVFIGESAKRANFERIMKGKQVLVEVSFQVPDLQESDGGGLENLSSLNGSDGEEDEGLQPRKFIKTRYQEFTPSRVMQNPVLRLGMEFASAGIFRKAVRAHVVKHRRLVQFKKNDSNRVKVVCKAESCKWTDNNVDASIWQYYYARNAARGMIHGSIKEQYSKLWEYYTKVMRMNPCSTIMMKCYGEAGCENPLF